MTMPKAYEPVHGQRYQILTRNLEYSREWEHCDYAVDKKELKYLLGEYRGVYKGFDFKTITLPTKYHEEVSK